MYSRLQVIDSITYVDWDESRSNFRHWIYFCPTFVQNSHNIFYLIRRRIRHRLPKSALKKLPIHKFKNGDPFETCCICLDDFEEGEKLRILPCDHGYHSKCIDSWLVKHKRICPQCRKRVFDRGSGYSSDSEDNERAPLLGGRPSTSSSTGNGTFASGSGATAGPSTSGVLSRLQQPPPEFLTTNESRRLLQHRRFRRPRRLRRVYEVLSESTTDESGNEEDPEETQEDQENVIFQFGIIFDQF